MTLAQSSLSQTEQVAHVVEETYASYLATAADLELQLDQTARACGYRSYLEMENCLTTQRKAVDQERAFQLLKRLAPAHHQASEQPQRLIAAVDTTGLAALADIHKAVARLIRIILLGYTDDEIGELSSRIKAERAQEVDSAVAQRRAEDDHDATIAHLQEMTRPASKAAP